MTCQAVPPVPSSASGETFRGPLGNRGRASRPGGQGQKQRPLRPSSAALSESTTLMRLGRSSDDAGPTVSRINPSTFHHMAYASDLGSCERGSESTIFRRTAHHLGQHGSRFLREQKRNQSSDNSAEAAAARWGIQTPLIARRFDQRGGLATASAPLVSTSKGSRQS